jgi:hypothetical protein
VAVRPSKQHRPVFSFLPPWSFTGLFRTATLEQSSVNRVTNYLKAKFI